MAHIIFQIVATELDSSDDLSVWFEISEMIDRLDFDDKSFVLNEDDVISSVTDVLFWQEIVRSICPQSDGNIDRKKGEAHNFL